MTIEFQYLMNLVGCDAQGKKPARSSDYLDWERLRRLASEQTVVTLAAFALKANPDIDCPGKLRDAMISSMRGAAVKNYMRREHIMKLLKRFEEEGIHAVLLKGYAIAGEYCSPECRVSADTDIWVAPKDEEKACEFLKKQGFAVEPRWKNGHHAVCHHPTMGCVELHVILYDEIVEEIWFNKTDGHEFICEPNEKVDGEDGTYYTLGKTDHLIFLTLHMIKHFIISGMSLRMMLDVALFMKNHSQEVNVERFWDTMRNLKYEKCVNTILWAMVQYAGFRTEDFPGIDAISPDGIDEVIADLEIGGNMGMNDKTNREDGWNAYNRELLLKNKSQIAYKLYMVKWQSSNYIKALFPSRIDLAKRYPYVMEKPWLIPYAWTHRLLFRGLRTIHKGNLISHTVADEKQLTTTGKERLEMFRRLGML